MESDCVRRWAKRIEALDRGGGFANEKTLSRGIVEGLSRPSREKRDEIGAAGSAVGGYVRSDRP